LREYLHTVRPKLAAGTPGSNVLFVTRRGKPLTKNQPRKVLLRYATKAGITTPLHPHSLRHACATHLLRAGADIRYVQELLGHESLNSTQIYTRVDISHLKQAHHKYHPRERSTDEHDQEHGHEHDRDEGTPANR
jgi:integrase/recombinase XerD